MPRGWDILVPELERRGHEVARMNLPGDTPEASARRYADLIAQSMPVGRDDAIVVAHSASGLFLPLVAEKRRVHRLGFLAAVIPQVGKSFYDQINENKDMRNPDWVGKDPTKEEQVARQFLFHDCSPEVSKWALSTLRFKFARQAMLEGEGLPLTLLAVCCFLVHPVSRRPNRPCGLVPPCREGTP
jgi:hypothetical protein